MTYLKEKKLELIANELKNVEVYYMLMSWQTLNNYKDCGIFLMRHMETYKGDPKNWITDLKHESVSILNRSLDVLNIFANNLVFFMNLKSILLVSFSK